MAEQNKASGKGPKVERMSIEGFVRAFILKARSPWTDKEGVVHEATGINSAIARVNGGTLEEVYQAYLSAGKLQEGAPATSREATDMLRISGKLVIGRGAIVRGRVVGVTLVLPEDQYTTAQGPRVHADLLGALDM